ncbi:hypothetical protein [Amycolatopsis sp. NPDC059657]|uniref:hypothetical protein n=1 Tax=Amycolatopsis sp. NPDC059657 TaxID=3346899 RepID=UPI00366AE9CD
MSLLQRRGLETSGRIALLGVPARYLCLTTDDHLAPEPHLLSLGKDLFVRL